MEIAAYRHADSRNIKCFLSGTGIVSILLPLVMSMALQQKQVRQGIYCPLPMQAVLEGY